MKKRQHKMIKCQKRKGLLSIGTPSRECPFPRGQIGANIVLFGHWKFYLFRIWFSVAIAQAGNVTERMVLSQVKYRFYQSSSSHPLILFSSVKVTKVECLELSRNILHCNIFSKVPFLQDIGQLFLNFIADFQKWILLAGLFQQVTQK